MRSDVLPERAVARLSDSPLTGAFAARRPFPWFERRPAPVADMAGTWETLLDGTRHGKATAYIHVPFCANHCLFCNFYENSSRSGFSRSYAEALVRDIAMDAERQAVRSGPVHAVYFGGGTPTAMEAEDLQTVIRAVRTYLPLAPDCEITIEGRVAGFGVDKAAACMEAGANRISIGVQTFDTTLRRRLGRKADRQTVMAFLTALRDLDRAAVICDLIYGLPGQSLDAWRADVETVADLDLDGVDLYCLTLFGNSLLARSIDQGKLPAAPSLAERARMYATGLETLENAGWRHCTQAHWARTTRERNLYNQLSKAQAECLAYGSRAGGLLDGHRYMMDGDEAAYRRRVAAGEKPLGGLFERPSDLDARGAITDMLERGRIVPDRLEAVAGVGFGDLLAPVLDHWTDAGLIDASARHPAWRSLTDAGWFWHVNLVGGLYDLVEAYRGDRPPPSPQTERMPLHAS